MCRLLLFILLLFARNVIAQDFSVLAPNALVTEVVENILVSVRQDRNLALDSSKIVDVKLLPYVDFTRMTQLTIGSQYWDEATAQDQLELVGEFHTLLAHTFANAIAMYTNQTVVVLPLHYLPEDQRTVVRTTIVDPADEPTQLDFAMEHAASGWFIYDLVIDNMRLSRIYRVDFEYALLQGGVHNLIGVLHRKNHEVEAEAAGHG